MAAMLNKKQSVDVMDGQDYIWHQAMNFASSMSVRCATQLGIPDIIHKHGSPMTLNELVGNLKINSAKTNDIYRLMRFLVHSGFFAKQKINISSDKEEEEEGYSLTPFSQILVETHPFSLKHFLLFQLDPIITKPWHHLSEWFQNDDSTVFHTVYGKPFWEVKEEDKRFSNYFDTGMAVDTPLIASTITRDYSHLFEGLGCIVDVGGGTGTLAKVIANTFPHIHCTVLDLPHVVAGLNGTQNLEYVGGDMFHYIPPTDAILMKWMLHAWCNGKDVEIMKKCKEAITSNGKKGKVIMIEIVVDDQTKRLDDYGTQLFFDMMMMMNKGKERTEKEWAKLFFDSGFSNYKIIPFSGIRSIIEVYP